MTVAVSHPPEVKPPKLGNFRAVVFVTMGIVTTVLLLLIVVRPELMPRALRTMTIVNALGASLLLLARRSTRLASGLFVAGLTGLVTFNALSAGGIRSPGVSAYLIFPLMAAVLLGGRAAVVTALACVGLAFGLVELERAGLLVQTTRYDAVALWFLNCIYMSLSVFLVRTATGTLSHAMSRASAEVTARRLAEHERLAIESQLRQSKKMEALGRLAGGIAHDFNNILTAIGGNATLAAPLAPPGPVRESLDEIQKAHERATTLVRQILTFSRHRESARRRMRLEPVIEEAIQMVRATIPATIQVRTLIAADLPDIEGDATQLHQVLMNLATNAVHAMAQTGGILTVIAECVDVNEADAIPGGLRRGRYACLTVQDTGTGMAPDVRERVFEPFFTTKGEEGTGLGLAVVYGIVRDHRGAVTIESEPGNGTVARVFLPAA